MSLASQLGGSSISTLCTMDFEVQTFIKVSWVTAEFLLFSLPFKHGDLLVGTDVFRSSVSLIRGSYCLSSFTL